MANATACDLFIPNKEWARELSDEQYRAELDNYLAIERWSRKLPSCLAGCTCFLGKTTVSVTPASGTQSLTTITFASLTAITGTYAGTNCLVQATASWAENATGARELTLNNPAGAAPATTTQPGLVTGRGQFQTVTLISSITSCVLGLWQNSGGALAVSVKLLVTSLCGCKTALPTC